MFPEVNQEDTNCLPKAQSKSVITQVDAPGMVAPDEDVSLRIPDIQPCVHFAEAASIELPLNMAEDLIRGENYRPNYDATILDQEFAFPFPDPASTLEIQGFATSDQGAQGSFSSPSSLEHLTSRETSSGGFQPSNFSYGGATVPDNSMGQNPQPHFPLFSDPFEYELEKLRREEENLKKSFEETKSELQAELKRKMDEARCEYDKQSHDLDAEYNAKVMEEEAIRSFVGMNSLLANAFRFKCAEKSEDVAALRGKAVRSIQHPIQQLQALQTNTHVSSIAPPSVMARDAPIPNPSGPLLQYPHCTSSQPAPGSQQAEQSNTYMNSTAPPRPLLTAAEAPIRFPSAPLLHFLRRNTARPTPISQRPAVQTNTHVNSTSHQPSVTAVEALNSNLPGPFSHFPRRTTNQPRSMPWGAAVQSNTHLSSTALSRPSVTAEARSLHSLRCNMSQPRPPPIISNLTPSSSPPVHGIVRAPAPHLQPFRSSKAPNSAAATTTYPRRLVQEEQQGNSSSGLVYLSDDEE